ncbi:phage portal protein, lambda family [Desulfacinum infernum DSM 9756]|uniref:Phage portal protein, lambda family n=1 Tax=Desulfacinum infernum DSM 9756 TaxID=1121391 RepID=A0A1M4S7X1_9BACT|nr:phage portal protein, lambda family [Desulfacinum infernum DSM 9756]
MFGGFITQPYDEDDLSPLGLSSGVDAQGRDLVALEPGTFPVLDPGMDIRFAEPADVGGQYEAWVTQQLRRIAKGVGITYEQLSGDLRGVTYSSVRAALLEFRRFCKQIQLQVLAFQFCRCVAVMWMDLAVLSGVLPIRDYWDNRRTYLRVTWRPDGWDWVDPWKDQKAEQLSVRCGFKSRAQVIAERGGDVDVVVLWVFFLVGLRPRGGPTRSSARQVSPQSKRTHTEHTVETKRPPRSS